jgi:prevent-host-death family protein
MGKISEIGIFESKTQLSELIQRVLEGERFFITRRGKRVAELRPIEPEKRPLKRGQARNSRYRMAEDFDGPLQELKDYQ